VTTWTILTPAIRCPECGAVEGERENGGPRKPGKKDRKKRPAILKCASSRTIGHNRLRYVDCRRCGASLRVIVRLDWRPGDGDTVRVRAD
jgi:DNA-directed RNA polymerase subunit RPC12/RpoP